jgi:hypothetical protein
MNDKKYDDVWMIRLNETIHWKANGRYWHKNRIYRNGNVVENDRRPILDVLLTISSSEDHESFIYTRHEVKIFCVNIVGQIVASTGAILVRIALE